MRISYLPLLLIILLVSCAKNQSIPDAETKKDTIPTGTSHDPIPQFAVTAMRFTPISIYLQREISYSANNPFLKNIKLFSYDNAKRCTEIKLGTIDSSISNPVFTLKQTLSFSYEGASILPASFSSVRTVFPNLVTTFYYKYNNLGRKILDSARVKNQAGNPADRVIHYSYMQDEVHITPVFTGFPLENNSLDTLSILSGGNIEKQVARFIKATGDQIIQYTYTYDQAFSPYNKLNIANSLYFESASLGIGYNVPFETHYMGVTTNNMTSWTTGTFTMRFKYLYDQNNYPVKKETYLPGDVVPSQVTWFEY